MYVDFLIQRFDINFNFAESANKGYDADLDDSSILLGQEYGSEEKPQTKKKYGPYLESRKRYGEKSKGEKAICRELLKRLQSLVPGLEGGGM